MSKLLSDALAAKIRGCLPETARRVACPEPPGAAMAAAVVAAAERRHGGAMLAVLPSPAAMERFVGDAFAFAAGRGARVLPFPMLDLAGEDPEGAAARMEAAEALAASGNAGAAQGALVVVACAQALMQPLPDLARARKLAKKITRGERVEFAEFCAWMAESGYRREPDVYEPGTFAVRGGVVDVWAVAARAPLRFDFFGDEVESIREFEPVGQASRREVVSAEIPPARLPAAAEVFPHALAPEGSAVVWIGLSEIEREGGEFGKNAEGGGARLPLSKIQSELAARAGIWEVFCGDPAPADAEPAVLPFGVVDGISVADARRHDPEFLALQRRRIVEECSRRHAANRCETHFCLDTPGILEHLEKELEWGAEASGFSLRVAPLSGGFTVADAAGGAEAAFISQADLYGMSKRHRATTVAAFSEAGGAGAGGAGAESGAGAGRSGDSATGAGTRDSDAELALPEEFSEDIRAGDLVVHLQHGIGRFEGLVETEIGGHRVEALKIIYAGDAAVFVPVGQACAVSKYTGADGGGGSGGRGGGGGGGGARLHTIGSKRWSREKESAAAAVQNLALRMLETQARRLRLAGRPFARETLYLHEFEAAFPYAETKGQAECIRKVKEDLASPHPMDRLVCGDAGYGKTEVAMRAAFICAMQGRQVAVLVPTTVLAQQHFDTFRDRMAAYPLGIALHCRFCSDKQRAAALAGAADGSVDIVIGTHGILQPGVRFKNLGLVIIDEEQRFGVKHKEHLKSVRLMVDVLTLSATPIPRTLYLGMMGARDLSLLSTPPRSRVAVETIIAKYDDALVARAIHAELGRGGQVFYLHNRVMTIGLVHERLRQLLPGARIAVGHGQMPASQVEAVMRDFAEGKFDVLLCTTIIESGIDIPRANTIIIDRADRFGVADLYQLRGRVGRGAVKASAYLLIPGESYVAGDAMDRLKALKQHGGLGSGVRLAMRDLTARGAGNLLGSEQSGHIAAIGFALYCRLLNETVARLKGASAPASALAAPPTVALTLPFLERSPATQDASSGAFLPYDYIDDDARRLEFFTSLGRSSTPKELAALRASTRDRFGVFPRPLERLFAFEELRHLAAAKKITSLEIKDGLVIAKRGATQLPPRFLPAAATADAKLETIRKWLEAME